MARPEIGKYIRSIHRKVRALLDGELRAYGLNESRLEYLVTIYENEGINQKVLGEILDVGKPGVTKAVGRLLNDGFIRRETDPRDGRNYRLYTTEKGRETGRRCDGKFMKISELILSEFSDEEREALTGLLERLYRRTAELSSPGSPSEK